MKYYRYIFGTVAVFTFLFGQNNRATIQSGPIDYLDYLPERPLCAVPIFSDEFIASHLQKMKKEYPDIYRRMQIPPKLNKSSSVGTVQKFWVLVDDGNGGQKSEEVEAELLAKGDYTAIWADKTKISDSPNISKTLAERYVKLLEESTPEGSIDPNKGVYQLELEYFGSPPNKDGDGIVDFLFADVFAGAGGYFYPYDQSNGSGSNRRDIVYIDTYASVSYTEATLSHELQHLIHYNYDTNETIHFNEGLSEVATIITGGAYISHAHYLNQADKIGWTWEPTAGQYSMASLFAIYFVEQLGYNSIKDFINISKDGWQAFNELLQKYNIGLNHKEWLLNWFTANYLNNKTIDPKYGYTLWMPMKPITTAQHLSGQIESPTNIVRNYGVNYISYESSVDSMEITFTATGSYNPLYRSLEYNDSSVVINELANASKHLIYHVVNNQAGPPDTLKVNKAIFIVSGTENTSLTYNYVSEGTDASGWTGFEEIAYDDGTADTYTTADGSSFGFLGWGNNNAGSGWGVKFDPKMSVNQLVELKVVLGFDQEFAGSSTPADAEKDFNIHFYEILDADGNVKSVADPIKWSTTRSEVTGDWSRIDLTPYKEQLSNLGEIVITIVEDDTIGTYFGMDKNDNNYTYAYNFQGSGLLQPLSDFQLSEDDPLAGWNFLFRASYYIKDVTVPKLSAGFMQHSVFSDFMKIYVVGNSIMSADKITISANNAGYATVLETLPVASNDSLLMVEQFKLNTSGPLDITVRGQMRYSRVSIDTTFKYNVNYTSSKIGGKIASRDGRYSITIPENSLNEDLYLVAGMDITLPGTSALYQVENLSKIYTIGPDRKKLTKGATISIALDGLDYNDVSIAYWDGELWRELNSNLSEDGLYIEAIGSHLGNYTLIERGSGAPLAVKDTDLIPTTYFLDQNFPNPFNPDTKIHYDLPNGGQVSLIVYDLLGREINKLVDQYQPAGRYNAIWKGDDVFGHPVSSGIYFYQIRSRSFIHTKKMVLSR